MPSAAAAIFAAANRSVRNAFGRTVTYRRGGLSIAIVAVPSNQRLDYLDEAGQAVTFLARAFDIERAVLELNDEPIEPREGDQIDDEDGTFQVTPPPGAKCFTEDEDGLAYRVYTTRTAQS